jgi:hypothetical protein
MYLDLVYAVGCWRSISVNQEHLLCYGLNFIMELTRH